jgi:hypothetical protein
MNTDVNMMCEVPAILNVVNVACVKLTHISSQTILRAFCLMSLSLNENQKQATFGYQMQNEAADSSRIGLNLTLNNICARAWIFGIL